VAVDELRTERLGNKPESDLRVDPVGDQQASSHVGAKRGKTSHAAILAGLKPIRPLSGEDPR
jgi:hypothetical protein